MFVSGSWQLAGCPAHVEVRVQEAGSLGCWWFGFSSPVFGRCLQPGGVGDVSVLPWK